MRRRDFIVAAGLTPAIWPLAARAQQPEMPVVGFLRSSTRALFENLETAFRDGLKEGRFIAGQSVAVEFRYADNDSGQLQRMAAELVRRPVAVIVGNTSAAQAAKAAGATMPIVFASGFDPVRAGLVQSLSRPGGNITGVSFLSGVVGSKRLELLHGLVAKATTIAALVNRHTPGADAEQSELQAAATAMGLQLLMLEAGNEADIDAAVATAIRKGAGALFAGAGPIINSHRQQLIALAARHKLPASFIVREAVLEGGLMSYGPSQGEAYRQVGLYVARILKGESPADLPVVLSDKHEFVLNLKTAKALGVDIPPTLIALADEVIE